MRRIDMPFGAARVMALLFLLTMGVPLAWADIVALQLGVGNSSISGFAGPYADVQINRTDITHATLTFTSLTNSGNIYLFGGQGAVGVNVNALSWTLSALTNSNSGTGFTPGPLSNAGAGNEDGFGSFNQTIDSFDGYTHSSSTVSFLLTNTSGIWANAASVLTTNASGYLAGAHIFVTSSPANASNGALATGYAVNGSSSVPDGGVTLILFGGALFAVETLRRRFAA